MLQYIIIHDSQGQGNIWHIDMVDKEKKVFKISSRTTRSKVPINKCVVKGEIYSTDLIRDIKKSNIKYDDEFLPVWRERA